MKSKTIRITVPFDADTQAIMLAASNVAMDTNCTIVSTRSSLTTADVLLVPISPVREESKVVELAHFRKSPARPNPRSPLSPLRA